MLDIAAASWAWSGYARLADAVRIGGTVLEENAETPDNGFWEVFLPSSVGLTTPGARALAEIIQGRAERREGFEILDLACGNALYGLTLAARLEDARVTLLDWPNVLRGTRAMVEDAGLHRQARYIEGDMFEVPLGGPYDVIVASHVFHHFSEARCTELVERLHSALRPGGLLAINDVAPKTSSPENEPFAFLFSLTMLIWTHEGEAHPLSTYERWLRGAGFVAIETDPGGGAPSTLIIAERS
jgi:C-methyltransferase